MYFYRPASGKKTKCVWRREGGKGRGRDAEQKGGGGGVLNRTVNTISNLTVTVDYVLGMKNVTILFG